MRSVVIGASLALGAAFALPFTADPPWVLEIQVGWAFAAWTPPRHLYLPIAFWLLYAGVLRILGDRRDAPGVLGLLLVVPFAVEAGRDLITLRATGPVVGGAYGVYASVAGTLLLVLTSAAAAYAVRTRRPELYPLAGGAGVAVIRLAMAADVAGLAGLVGGTIAAVAWPASVRAPTIGSRRTWSLAVAFVLVAALALRMVVVTSLLRAHGFDYPTASDDGPSYDENAWMLVNGLLTDADRIGFFFNLYVVFAAMVFALFGHSFLALGAVQSVLGMWVAGMTLWIGRRFGAVEGWLAAAAVAVNSILILLSAYVGTEALMLPLLATAVVLLIAALEAHRQRRAIALVGVAGLFLGIGGVTRDVMLGLPVFVGAWLVWAFVRAGLGRRALAAITLAFLIGVSVGYFPFSIYRERWQLATGYLVPAAFYYGHPRLGELGIGAESGLAGSLRIVAERPLDVLGAYATEVWAKTDMLFLSSTFNTFDLVFLAPRTRFAATVELTFITLVGIGLFLLAFKIRARPEDRALLLLLPTYGFIAHVLLFHANSASRYRAIYDPVFAVAFGVGAAVVVRWLIADMSRHRAGHLLTGDAERPGGHQHLQ